MKKESERHSSILPVPRSKEEARQFYNRLSRCYDFISLLERKYALSALRLLSIKAGETVLEIGPGSGYCFKRIAQSVGENGTAYGIDISSGMLTVTRKKLEKAQLIDRGGLCCGDAAHLPYPDNAFDAAFTSFTLELIDTPEISMVLAELRRVLRPGGRLGIVSMSREDGKTALLRLYEWAHLKWPKYLDCRPIYPESSLIDAGYKIRNKQKVGLMGLPGEIVIAVNEK